jgi:surface antigen
LRRLLFALGGWGLITMSCLPALARTSHDVHHGRTSHDIHGGNCVAYAREVTGVRLEGNAATWWPHAEGRYERGHRPEVGAILVFKPYARMHVGHVAVVSRIVNAREVLLDHANWVRGRVTKAMSAIDTSPNNDWTSVEVQNGSSHGRDNPTYGFIYPRAMPANFSEAVAAAELGTPDAARDKHHATAADRVAARAKHHKNAEDEEVAAFRNAAPRHVAEHAVRHHPKADETRLAARAAEPAPQHVAEHAAHHKSHPAHDDAKGDSSPAQQVAAAAPAHHKHKAPDAALAYVY